MYSRCTAQMACACALVLMRSESIRFSRNMQAICAACIHKYDASFQKFQSCYISAVELCCTVTANISGISGLVADEVLELCTIFTGHPNKNSAYKPQIF